MTIFGIVLQFLRSRLTTQALRARLELCSREPSTEMPYVVHIKMMDGNKIAGIASGVIVGTHTVLTTAHFWGPEQQSKPGIKIHLYAGIHMGGKVRNTLC